MQDWQSPCIGSTRSIGKCRHKIAGLEGRDCSKQAGQPALSQQVTSQRTNTHCKRHRPESEKNHREKNPEQECQCQINQNKWQRQSDGQEHSHHDEKLLQQTGNQRHTANKLFYPFTSKCNWYKCTCNKQEGRGEMLSKSIWSGLSQFVAPKFSKKLSSLGELWICQKTRCQKTSSTKDQKKLYWSTWQRERGGLKLPNCWTSL